MAAHRRMQLWKHLSDPSHPYSKFGTGNLETLGSKPKSEGINVHARVVDFYNTKYSANLMKLVSKLARLCPTVRTHALALS